MPTNSTIEELRIEFERAGRRSLSFPIAGTIVWTATGVFGALLPVDKASIALFVCTAMIFPMSLAIARVLGEEVFSGKTKNPLDGLMGRSVVMVQLVWGIAIPFWFVYPSSLPLSVGILAGLHWIVFGWIIGHWVGMFHAVTRTILIVAAWFVFPDLRFVVIPAIVVAVYAVTIVVLATRRLSTPMEPAGA